MQASCYWYSSRSGAIRGTVRCEASAQVQPPVDLALDVQYLYAAIISITHIQVFGS